MARWSGCPPEDFAGDLYEYYDEAAIGHLFRVAAGLDSAVLGEGEVLGQVGDAWEAAREEGTAGPVLSILFRHAVEAGKRVRSETLIARGTTSLSQAAVALAGAQLGSLAGRTTLVMGAGEMGEAMAQALAGGLEAGPLLVANRTWSKATELAARCGGRAIEWSGLPDGLVQADVVLASTGSPDTLLEASDLEAVMTTRGGRPLLIVDIAVPRDVDPAVGDLPGVTLLDMDDLSAFAAARSRRPAPGGAQGRGDRGRGGRAVHGPLGRAARGPAGRRPARARRADPDGRARTLRPPAGWSGSGAGPGRRGAEPGHRGQAAPRANRQSQGRGRLADRRAAGSGPAAAVRPVGRPRVVRSAPLRLATRGSALARWQAAEVARLLREVDPDRGVELVVVATTGDRRQDVPVWQMGGQGVFVKEVQAAVLEGRADAAVHSAKDLPSRTEPGLVLAAIPKRADPRDVLVGSTLAGLGPGALVATGSVRRRAQLAWLRPDLTFAGLRGNIATRLDRVPTRGAVVMAMAALERLGLAARASEVLDVSVMLPQVGQGAIGVRVPGGRRSHARGAGCDRRPRVPGVRGNGAGLSGPPRRRMRSAGRGLRRGPGRRHHVEGLLASPDGRVLLRGARTGPSPSIGADLAESLLASGGADLMAGGLDGGPPDRLSDRAAIA